LRPSFDFPNPVTCSLAGPAPFAVKQAVIIIAAKKAAMKAGFLVMNGPCESMSAPKFMPDDLW